MDTAGNEPFEKLEKQLDETQALGWRMGQYMAESRNVLSSCIRLKSELQYEWSNGQSVNLVRNHY